MSSRFAAFALCRKLKTTAPLVCVSGQRDSCETKNLDKQMAALGGRKPQKAVEVERLRAARLAREQQQ
jgi:hypothetical protein